MSLKRKDSPLLSASDNGSDKRQKPNSSRGSKSQASRLTYAQVDATYGQRSFFPEPLADHSNVDEDSAAALAYLSSVRYEASSIPHLLVGKSSRASAQATSNQAIQQDFYDDDSTQGGFYEDGAYLAAPAPLHKQSRAEQADADADTDDMVELSAIEAYHARMLARFDSIHELLGPDIVTRRVMLAEPDLDGITARPPQPPFLNDLMDRSVQELLLNIETKLTKARLVGNKRDAGILGSWCWSLLARTPEYGTLDNAEMGVVRELGKKAARLAKKIAQELLEDPHALDSRFEIPRPQRVGVGKLNRRRRNSSSSVESSSGPTEPMRVNCYRVLTVDEAYKISDEAKAKDNARKANAKQSDGGKNKTKAGTNRDGITGEHDDDSDEDGEIDENKNDDEEDNGDDKDNQAVEQKVWYDDPSWEDSGDAGPLSSRHVAVGTLDMILTVVAERFGQRDLLEARDMLWELDEIAGPGE